MVDTASLAANSFYSLSIPWSEDEYQRLISLGWQGVPQTPWDTDSREKWTYMDYYFGEDSTNQSICSRSREHTRIVPNTVIGDFFPGVRGIPDFIHASPSENLFISDSLATKLSNTSFRGYTLLPVGMASALEGRAKDVGSNVKFLRVDSYAQVSTAKIVGGPNACPFCNDASPIMCPECGSMQLRCPTCKKWQYINEENVLAGKPSEGRRSFREILPIIAGRTWDGSDWIKGLHWDALASKRLVQWLLSVHAAPFNYRPVVFDPAGCSQRQLDQLREIKQPH